MVAFPQLLHREYEYKPPSQEALQYQNEKNSRFMAAQFPAAPELVKDAVYSTPYFQYSRSEGGLDNKALEIKKVIKEMVRTRVTVPNVVLLVDKIIIVRVASPNDSAPINAYRLYLTDMEKSIQAVFKRRIHKEIASLEIREGSYIALKEYSLATGPRLNGEGDVEYIAVSDFQWMGEQRRYEFQNVEHDFFGTLKRRPEEAHTSVIHPDSGHRLGLIGEHENWRMKYHHPLVGGEQYRITHSRLADPSSHDESVDYLPDCDEKEMEEKVYTSKGNPVEVPPNFDVDRSSADDSSNQAKQGKVDNPPVVEGLFEGDQKAHAVASAMSEVIIKPGASETSAAVKKRKRVSSTSDSGRRSEKARKENHNIFDSPDAGWRIASAGRRLLAQHPGWLRRRVEETKMRRGPTESIDLYSLTAITHVFYDPYCNTTLIPPDRPYVHYNHNLSGLTDVLESKWVIRIALEPSALTKNGLTAEGVATMLVYNYQNIRAVFNRDKDKHQIVRVRMILEEGDEGSEEESLRLASLLLKSLMAKGPFFLDRTRRSYEHVPSQIAEDGKVSAPATVFASRESPWATEAVRLGTPLEPIDQPLELSNLASITGRNRSRNKVVDVLAKVDSVDDFTVKRTHMPLKRDIYITDQSTSKKIPLSIFTNPLVCTPKVGDLVLFRNVVTHDFRGGALNAYPKQCEGKDWCIPFPYAVEGHHTGLEQAIVRFLDDDDDRILLTTKMGENARFHQQLSAKWPKHKRRMWKQGADPKKAADAEKVQRWNLVADPPICPHCEEPHINDTHVRGAMKSERRGTEWDEEEIFDCIRHEAFTDDDDSDSMED